VSVFESGSQEGIVPQLTSVMGLGHYHLAGLPSISEGLGPGMQSSPVLGPNTIHLVGQSFNRGILGDCINLPKRQSREG